MLFILVRINNLSLVFPSLNFLLFSSYRYRGLFFAQVVYAGTQHDSAICLI